MGSPKVVTVIQARTGSTRLPGKVLRPLLGQPLLLRLIERVRAARLVDTIVVATTTDPADDAIATLCQRAQIQCYRGRSTDLLDRHYQVGRQYRADAIVKIPSDCPLIDPVVVDRVLAVYLETPFRYDYVSNLHPATYPDGNDVEVMSMGALTTAWQEADRDFEREHTTPFIWENPERFRLGNVTWETDLDYSMSHRWTIDYEPDYRFVQAIYAALFPQNPFFGLEDILQLLAQDPALAALNEIYAGVNWYRHYLPDLRTVTPSQTRQMELKEVFL